MEADDDRFSILEVYKQVPVKVRYWVSAGVLRHGMYVERCTRTWENL
jgi:hypothetical protein